jgi:hypothetical protein
MAIYRVPVGFVADIWPSIRSFVDGACEFHPFMDSADILALLENEMGTLFIATDAHGVMGFATLEVVKYPRLVVANVLASGGRPGFSTVAVNELLPFMIEHGKTQGATVVAYSGRPGWIRKLTRFGGQSQRFITWWADIHEQGRRKLLSTADDHAGTVEASATIPH